MLQKWRHSIKFHTYNFSKPRSGGKLGSGKGIHPAGPSRKNYYSTRRKQFFKRDSQRNKNFLIDTRWNPLRFLTYYPPNSCPSASRVLLFEYGSTNCTVPLIVYKVQNYKLVLLNLLKDFVDFDFVKIYLGFNFP